MTEKTLTYSNSFFPQLFIRDHGFTAIKKALTKLTFHSFQSLEVFECCLQILSIATSYTILRSWLLTRKHIDTWIELAVQRLLLSYEESIEGPAISALSSDSSTNELKRLDISNGSDKSSLTASSRDDDFNSPDSSVKNPSTTYLKCRLMLTILAFSVNDSNLSSEKGTSFFTCKSNYSSSELINSVELCLQNAAEKYLAFADVLPQVILLCPSISILNLLLHHLQKLVKSSPENAIKISSSKVMDYLLIYLFDPPNNYTITEPLKDLLYDITLNCASYGLSNNNTAKILNIYINGKSPLARYWLAEALSKPVSPALYFNPLVKGYSSIDFTLSTPVTPDNGYSISLWLHSGCLMETLNINKKFVPTTIFLVTDFLKSPLLRVMVDPSTNSISVHFGSYATSKDACIINYCTPLTRSFSKIFNSVKTPTWRLITLVHRNEKLSSMLDLYIDGTFVERAPCSYPFIQSLLQPLYISLGPSMGSKGLFQTSADNNQRKGGSLKSDISEKNRETNDSSANLLPLMIGTTRFFTEPLLSSQIAIIYGLGPNYTGSFQGSINEFLTYKASAELSLEVQASNLNAEDVLRNIKSISSSSIAFTACAKNYINISDPRLSDFSSFSVLDTLKNLQDQFYSYVYINRAVPSYNQIFSIDQPSFGVSSGSVTPVVMPSFSDALYNVGGSSILLKLVSIAETEDELNFGLLFFLSAIEDNWRFSEQVEQGHSFEILAKLLRSKSHLLISEETLRSISSKAGIHHERFKHPFIINPLLFRYLMLDFDLWSKAKNNHLVIQQLGYIVSLIENNEYSALNIKRLMRMQVLKKLLAAMRGRLFRLDVLPLLKVVLKILLTASFVSDNVRTIVTYIIYAAFATKRSSRTNRLSNASPNFKRPEEVGEYLDIKESGHAVCEVFVNLLIESDQEPSFLRRFSSMITPAWLLFLIRQPDSHYFLFGLRLLNQSVCSLGSSFISKFSQKFHGFLILKSSLPNQIHIEEVWLNLILLALGLGVRGIEFKSDCTFEEKLNFMLLNYKDRIFPISEMIVILLDSVYMVLKKLSLSEADVQMNESLYYAQQTLLLLTDAQISYSLNISLNFDLNEHIIRMVFPFFSPKEDIVPEQEIRELMEHVRHPLPRSSSSKAFSQGIRRSVRKMSVSGSNRRVVTPLTNRVRQELLNEQLQKSNLQPSLSPKFDTTAFFENTVIDGSNSKKLINGLFISFLTNAYDRIVAGQGLSLSKLIVSLPSSTKAKKSSFVRVVFHLILQQLIESVKDDKMFLTNPHVLINFSYMFTKYLRLRLVGFIEESCLSTIDEIGYLLEKLDSIENHLEFFPKNAKYTISNLYGCFLRLILLELARTKERNDGAAMEHVMKKILYWQTPLLVSKSYQPELFPFLWYSMYIVLKFGNARARLSAVDVWRLLYIQSPYFLDQVNKSFRTEFSFSQNVQTITGLQSDQFLSWLQENTAEADKFMQTCFSFHWEDFIKQEHKAAEDELSSLKLTRLEFLKKSLTIASSEQNLINEMSHSYEAWISSLYSLECTRFRKLFQDQSDQENFVMSAVFYSQSELAGENSILSSSPDLWELDSTEGSERMRNRLRPCILPPKEMNPKQELERQTSSTAGNRSFDSSVSSEIPLRTQVKEDITLMVPFNEDTLHDSEADTTNEPTFGKDDEDNEDEEDKEDKNRTVMRSIVPGDTIQDAYNVSRIFGLEAMEGILLLGKQYLYLMDNFFLRSDNEIVDINDSSVTDEKDPYLQLLNMQSINSSRNTLPTVSRENSWYWNFSDLSLVLKRFYLLRDVGIELFFKDGRSFLTILSTAKSRDALYQKLIAKAHGADVLSTSHLATSMSRDLGKATNKTSFIGSRLANVLSFNSGHPATKRWERHEISNFNYLQIVNTLAGRTYNDLTQYPVFPWVIADYTSEELDLSNPRTFRDLSKPMGAQYPPREAQFKERYELLLSLGDLQQKPFHYGTHYSSAMIVCSYLIRLRPFVDSYLALQGGQFDHADRLFYSIEQTWNSSSKENMADVRELIPEFFYLSEMFVNSNGFDFGARQNETKPISDVILPPWAKGDPAIFVQKNREALESKYVSSHLHEWIDLVFGYKQRGDEAVESTNVFHNLSYQGSIDLENIENEFELAAAVGIIHNFGQTPKQVFKKPHPPRGPDFTDTPLGPYLFGRFENNMGLLFQSVSPIIIISKKIAHILYDPTKDTLRAFSADCVPLSSYSNLIWNGVSSDVELVMEQTDSKLVVFEELHSDKITHLLVCDERTFLTASSDLTLRLWQLSDSKPVRLSSKKVLYGHRANITSVAVCKAFSIIVSGDETGHLMVWDLNRAEFVRSVRVFRQSIQTISVNARNGEIAFSAGHCCCIIDINGKVLVKDTLSRIYNSNLNEDICSSCFYTGANSEWLNKDLFLTGHEDGIVRIWEKRLESKVKLESNNFFDKPKWRLHLIRQLQHKSGFGRNKKPTRQTITCITCSGQARGIFIGDNLGQVHAWMLPDTTSNVHVERDTTTDLCSLCDTRFSLMEWRSQCRACGNSNVCSDCISILKNTNIKTCYECHRQLPSCYKG
ncbi:beige protein [Schizosaccharomyces cryophilus OY26]|uniref:Beige protein n=1 Tax=Schizosaccharomyces cryophilus (strain OY26 / ATCC MYA-4695 / CBS 11777 / NBRC 106824 / NRRL Y48691) TaxID=653667 RepID=S9W2X3_SCHCR|nr:beige protein [Schizosaccharomyces cryophilus OY26]EPY52909.1 beige protein [Schizosaccharomyces cryophilus OY26]